MELNIGMNIKRLRLAKGLTQEQLAELLTISTAAVSKWEAKNTYPDVKLVLILPCLEQADRWKEIDKLNYEEIKRRADEVVFVSEHYTKFCMQARNRALVDRSSVCISYLEKSTGGTAFTVNYANKSGIKVINLI